MTKNIDPKKNANDTNDYIDNTANREIYIKPLEITREQLQMIGGWDEGISAISVSDEITLSEVVSDENNFED